MKKKIAIITIIDNNNLGNRLQNYAIQSFYEKLGFEAITLKNRPRTNNVASGKFTKQKDWMTLLIKNLIDIFRLKKWSKRYRCFMKFNKNIKFSKRYITYSNADMFSEKYDFFSVGSDQVWNYEMNRLSYIERLDFSKREKNIAFAASAAINNFDKVDNENLKRSFLNFHKISVREDKTKQLIEKLTGRKDIVTVIDPTLLLEKKEWESLEKKPYFLKDEDYVLLYFLHGMSEDAKIEIQSYAEKRNFRMIDISNKSSDEYQIGPTEFLYLENHAKMIFTDSFHSCCYAINFGTPFVVFKRMDGKMYSRIETLLDKFRISDSEYNGEIKDHTYERAVVEQILESEKNRIMDMIQMWLK